MIITGNTILITGGGSGIGRGLAHAFHDAGNVVIVAGRRASPLEETIAGRDGMSFKLLDVGDADAITTLAAEVVTEHPGLNVVVNNAGIMKAENLLAEPFDPETPEATIATNLLGPIRLTAALLPHLRQQKASTVINVTSGLAFVPLAMTPTYNATKAAIHSYTQSLRYQLKSTKVQVIELIPPYVQTELMGSQQASDPRAMPLADYLSETINILKTQPEATEVLVERVKPLRFSEQNGPEKYTAFFTQFNDAMAVDPH